MGAAAIGWQAMGKPDFATCGKLFYRLPADLREGLNRSEEKVLIWAMFTIWRQSYHSGRNIGYAQASAQYLGKKFGRSRSTVHRALKKLLALQLVTTVRRRWKSSGKWQCNLWALGSRMHAILHAVLPAKSRTPPCRTFQSPEVKTETKREKVAAGTRFATPSLSLSSFLDSREKEWKQEVAEKEVEKGTLRRLFEQFRSTKEG